MILTVGHTKGGVGKSTLAAQLAITRTIAGKNTLLVDGDRQGSSTIATAIRHDAGHQPSIPCLPCQSISDFAKLEAHANELDCIYSDFIIDAGGRDNLGLRNALVISHTILIPLIPRSVDLWALEDIAAMVNAAREANPALKAYVILNKADPGISQDNEDAIEEAKIHVGLEYLDCPILDRKAFANATGQGICVSELKRKDRKAEAELDKLASLLF
jgi:chromosome partitioning protein